VPGEGVIEADSVVLVGGYYDGKWFVGFRFHIICVLRLMIRGLFLIGKEGGLL